MPKIVQLFTDAQSAHSMIALYDDGSMMLRTLDSRGGASWAPVEDPYAAHARVQDEQRFAEFKQVRGFGNGVPRSVVETDFVKWKAERGIVS